MNVFIRSGHRETWRCVNTTSTDGDSELSGGAPGVASVAEFREQDFSGARICGA